MSESTPVSPPAARRLPGSCLMILVVGGWFLALGGWMAWHLYGQVKDMRNYTDPAAQQIVPVPPGAAELRALQEKLRIFGQEVTARKAATLELGVPEMNHLLAAQEPVNQLQDLVRVEEITDVIRVKVALAINGIPLSGERLFLNGFISARPEIRPKSGLVLVTRSLEVPGREVSAGFSQRYLEANHLDGLVLDEVRKDSYLNAVLTKITAVRCEQGKVIAEYLP